MALMRASARSPNRSLRGESRETRPIVDAHQQSPFRQAVYRHRRRRPDRLGAHLVDDWLHLVWLLRPEHPGVLRRALTSGFGARARGPAPAKAT